MPQTIILRVASHPLCKKFPRIDSVIPSLLNEFLPPVQTSLEMTVTCVEESFEESSKSLDCELVSSSHDF